MENEFEKRALGVRENEAVCASQDARRTVSADEPDTPALSALVYIARGWRVLPLHGVVDIDGRVACTCDDGVECPMAGSHPLDGLTLDDATTSPSGVVSWWQQHPEANVGIVACEDSGLAVVTVDEDLLDPAVQPIVDAFQRAGAPTIRRPGRSTTELLFKSRGDGETGTELARGLDFLGGRGLVVAPPSRLPLGRVEWEAGNVAGPLAELPMTCSQVGHAVAEIGVPFVAGRSPLTQPASNASPASMSPSMIEPVLIAVSTIESRPVEWLLEHRIPLSELTILGGHPGAGKSMVASDLIARVTRGLPSPITGAPMRAGAAIIMGREEDPARAIRPRLEAAGADMARVFILNDVRELPGGERGLRLPHDVEAVERACREHDVRLVVIDPITDFLHRVDANSEQDVRRALVPLAELARRREMAIVFVRHLSKREHALALHSGIGSIAFGAVARAGLLVTNVDGQRVLRATKSSCCPEGVAPVAFNIVTSASGVGRIEWAGAVEEPAPVELVTALDRAKAFLIEQLAEGPVLAKVMLERAKQAGVAERNLREAKKKLGIKSDGRPPTWLPPRGCNPATPYAACSLAASDDGEE